MTRVYSQHRLRALELLKASGVEGIEATMIAQRLGINAREASRCMSRFIKQNIAIKEKTQGSYTRYFYKPPDLTATPTMTAEIKIVHTSRIIAEAHPAFVRINMKVGLERVSALKRLRRLLIEDYHPLLDLVIRDYEAVLQTEESEED